MAGRGVTAGKGNTGRKCKVLSPIAILNFDAGKGEIVLVQSTFLPGSVCKLCVSKLFETPCAELSPRGPDQTS